MSSSSSSKAVSTATSTQPTTSTTATATTSVLKSGLSGAFYLIGLQMASRLFTFVLNTWMVSAVDPSVLGVFAIKYQLLASFVLFLSREAIRRTCIRADLSQGGARELQRFINLSWMVVPCGLVLSVCGERLLNHWSTDEERLIPDHDLGLVLFTLASFLELLSEPVYILTQNMLLFKVRTFVEGSALFLKALATYYFVVITKDGLKGFGYAQIIYSVVLLIGYYGNFIIGILQYDRSNMSGKFTSGVQITSFNQLLPRRPSIGTGTSKDKERDRDIFGKDLVDMTMLYTWQSIQKLLLTEGEKIVLYLSQSLVSQAIFSVVSNLGSLVARFFFQPIEETCFTMFPKLFGAKSRKDDWADSSKVLTLLMKVMSIVAFIFIAFGPAFSELLLNILYPNTRFSTGDAGLVLGVYCVYVGFMAVNGVSEAFVHSVSKTDQLKTLNWILFLIGLLYLFLTYIFSTLWGTIGIILANCINMLARIIYSVYFMNGFFKGCKGFSLASMLPNKLPLLLFGLSFIMTNITGHYYSGVAIRNILIHVGTGALCFGLVLISLYLTEGNTFREVRRIIKSKQQ
ncbi:hypothetical protein SAMD00019534_069400 [Acytostelium subglobosum LB1]|uniref:hypothetical protein n=1 Tax=Acytostelium subglobosum LB1 TaxID=1410327 RepID=UPI00064508B8|nr:hypothetical protein SAMD00019534_069400 [Acytostelium subglobosum LB1]GAM23765.1 hypothetical protein SAMD00019534_069400 [Acytostelium subglobosum LB1]|eukprot:XP_012753506.1 hypothetical protein SAMD00019534_069400 [Acytostelium subglobosum LB1]